MNNRDKLIKLLATGLALLLAFGIITGIAGTILFFVRSGHNRLNRPENSHVAYSQQESDEDYEDDEDYYGDDEDYDEEYSNVETTSFSRSFTEEIENLDIESPIYAIEIQQGDVSHVVVECKDVLEDYTATVENKTLVLSGKKKDYNWGSEGLSTLMGILEGKSPSANRKVTITFPKNTTLNKCFISSGTGSLDISDITTGKFELSNGTGSLTANRITADSADIECGTGSIELKDIYFKKTNLETGTGSTNISGQLEGKTDIDSGMGSIDIKLKGSKNDYNFDIEKGLGSLTVDNTSYKELKTDYSGVSNDIDISGGMGSITIEFQYSS